MNIKGKYRGYSPVLSAVSILGGMFSALLCASGEPAALIAFLVIFTAMMALFVLSLNMPCRVRAGDRGFTVTIFGVENRFRYEDIRDISCEYTNTRYGGMIKLYVTDGSGETVFHELCSCSTLTDLLNDPENSEKPLLAQLCEYVDRVKEEGV